MLVIVAFVILFFVCVNILNHPACTTEVSLSNFVVEWRVFIYCYAGYTNQNINRLNFILNLWIRIINVVRLLLCKFAVIFFEVKKVTNSMVGGSSIKDTKVYVVVQIWIFFIFITALHALYCWLRITLGS